MWFYVSPDDEPTAVRRIPDPAIHSARDARPPRAIGRSAESVAPKAEPQPRSLKVRRDATAIAEALDAAALRLRTKWRRSPLVQVAAGRYELHSGRPADALRRFERFLERTPRNVSALKGKAAALAGLRRYAEAADIYDRLLDSAPGDAGARFGYGAVLTHLRRFTDAADQFRHALSIDPNHAESLYNLAVLAQRDGGLSEARDMWRRYTELAPDVADAWFNLGVVYLDFDRPFDAEPCFWRFLELRPDLPEGYVNLAAAADRLGDTETALIALRLADDLAPCEPAILLPLGDILRRLAVRFPDEPEHAANLARLDAQLDGLIVEEQAVPAELLAGSMEKAD